MFILKSKQKMRDDYMYERSNEKVDLDNICQGQ